jgi:NAD(P)-dependent dehydrogenase (short-subunit alcohol dehydrogenase family)
MSRVFFITGCGRGLGHALAQSLLDAGEYVVATTRNPSTMSFTNTTSSNYLPLKVDVTSTSDIEAAFDAALDKFTRIDAVINNAAYGLIGALETLTDDQVRSQFDTNFFPVVTITRRAVKTMRSQSPPGGIIIQIASIAALLGFPMVSTMCASKWAMEGFSEGVRGEMRPEWNIKITSVKLGAMNTDAHEKSMVYGELDGGPEYDHMTARAWVKSLNEMPTSDVKELAKKVYEVSKLKDPPFNTIIGADMLEMMKQRYKRDEELVSRGQLAG